MNLPLDMRATLLVASLDVIADEIDAVRRGRPVSPILEAVLAEARDSAQLLSDELYPTRAMAVGERHRPSTRPAVSTPTPAPGVNVVQLRPRRS